jgi:hypothetical protein
LCAVSAFGRSTMVLATTTVAVASTATTANVTGFAMNLP